MGNAKILKDIKFPMMLDCFDYCTPELQEKLVPMRRKFKDYEDAIVMTAQKGKGGKEAALKKAQEENEDKEMENYSFDEDVGSNNSGYYEILAITWLGSNTKETLGLSATTMMSTLFMSRT